MDLTPEQIENVKVFLWRWKSIPEKNVIKRLWDFQGGRATYTPTCGTVACAGGWMSLMPEFQAKGVGVSSSGVPTFSGTTWAHQIAAREPANERQFALDDMNLGSEWSESWFGEEEAAATPPSLGERIFIGLVALFVVALIVAAGLTAVYGVPV